MQLLVQVQQRAPPLPPPSTGRRHRVGLPAEGRRGDRGRGGARADEQQPGSSEHQ